MTPNKPQTYTGTKTTNSSPFAIRSRSGSFRMDQEG